MALAAAVAWGLLRTRRTRSSLARLVVELGESATAGGLRDGLAEALADPDLEIAYPVGDGRYADVRGRVVDPAPLDGRTATPLVRDGRPVALLLHRADLLDSAEPIEEVASAARLALENERLQAEARAQLEDLRSSRARIVEAGDAERRRLERDLHDGAQQRLVGLSLALRLLRSRLGSDQDGELAARLDEAEAELGKAIAELRELAYGIHPAVLSDEGLAAAVEALAEDAPVRIAGLPEERFSPAVETAAYLVVAEAVKTGAVRVSAGRLDGALVVDVEAETEPEGLLELEDRVGALDGRLGVERAADGASQNPRGDPMRLVVADDSMLLREGLARLLADAGFDVVGKAENAPELLRRVELTRPDVAIVDIKMPPTHTDEGIAAALEIRRAHPQVGVLVLSQYLESRYAMRLLEETPDGVGYLLKDRLSDIAVLADALKRIDEGECVIDPTIVSRLLKRPREQGAARRADRA